MILVGLTGGIGSGKSTVSAMLAAKGAVVVDADAVTKELQQPGQPVLAAIVERFGAEMLTADGALDRPRLAARVFGDPEELKALNAIVHPAVGVEINRRIDAERGGDRIVVLDVPLLVESSRYPVAGIVVVDVDEEIAVDRLVRFRGFAEADARARIARQATRDQRRARADRVVDNSGDLAALEPQVEAVWAWMATLPPAGPPAPADGPPAAAAGS